MYKRQRFLDADAAVTHGLRLAAEGADIVDVGGESTRPGAERVDADVELARVVPVVRALVAHGVQAVSYTHLDVYKRQNQQWITKENLDESIDRVIGGPQRRSRVMNERELLITAYHEGGHALVCLLYTSRCV